MSDLEERVAALDAMLKPPAKDHAIGGEVEAFLERTTMPTTKFGRLAVHDPRFVLDLRMGRTPRTSTGERIRAWMADYEGEAA